MVSVLSQINNLQIYNSADKVKDLSLLMNCQSWKCSYRKPDAT